MAYSPHNQRVISARNAEIIGLFLRIWMQPIVLSEVVAVSCYRARLDCETLPIILCRWSSSRVAPTRSRTSRAIRSSRSCLCLAKAREWSRSSTGDSGIDWKSMRARASTNASWACCAVLSCDSSSAAEGLTYSFFDALRRTIHAANFILNRFTDEC